MEFSKSYIWKVVKEYDNYKDAIKWTSSKNDMLNFIDY